MNNGGSSTLRDTQNDNKNSFTSPQRPIEDIDEDEYPSQVIHTGFNGDEVIMPSHKTKKNEYKNVTFNRIPLPDFSDHYETSWYAEDEPGLKTATPIKTAFDDNESDLLMVTPFKTAGFIETPPTPEQKAIKDEKRHERKERRESKTTPEQDAEKKELKRQQKAERDLKKSEMTPMKTRDKIVKIKDVFITSNMIIDELNEHDLVLNEIKKDKVRGINTMSRANIEKLFVKYMKVTNIQEYFNNKQMKLKSNTNI